METFAEAQSVFGCSPTVHSYNALLDAYSKVGETVQAFQAFEDMKNRGFIPNKTTFSSLILTCVNDGDCDRAVTILKTVRENPDLIQSGSVYSALIKKAVRLKRGELVSELIRLHKKDVGELTNDTKLYIKRGWVDYNDLTANTYKLKETRTNNINNTTISRY
eukprot:c8964_g1_i2.p1 GENE.c8964_g1_i2~~c8964_g1_i2.p1  ORF type:complete len:163 (+),score=46.69 c8964_g1_i2:109-597(+)